jgi:hypothetical protein
MGFTSHQHMHGGPPGCIVASAPTSLASIMDKLWWSVRTTPPSHTSEVAPKWTSGSTWFGKGSQESAGLSSCVLVTISPRRAKWGGGEGEGGGIRSVETPPPTPSVGAPPVGPCQEPKTCDTKRFGSTQVAASNLNTQGFTMSSNMPVLIG